MAFGIGLEAFADDLDGRLLANAGEDILQAAARRMVVKHLVGRQQRHTGVTCDAPEPRQAPPVVAAIKQARREPHAIGLARSQPLQNVVRFRLVETMRQHQHEKLAFGKFQKIIELQDGIRP